MLTKWKKYADDEKRIKEEYDASQYLFNVLDKILEELNEESLKKMRSSNIFKLPSWKDSIAYELGYQAAIDQFKQLIRS